MLLKNYQQSFQIKIDFVKFVSYRFLTVQCFRNSKTMSEINPVNYSEDNIRTLDWQEHIRLRPGMYIGKLGDGSSADDGIYILLKEIIDNSIDEFVMKAGKRIEIKMDDGKVSIRDFGRGIPLGKVVDAVSKMNTGGKYDSKAFKKSVGLNGVGTKAVNALSDFSG
jgi:topoisomerase-4 subunit B